MQHVGHRASDEIAMLNTELATLRQQVKIAREALVKIAEHDEIGWKSDTARAALKLMDHPDAG